MPVSRVLFPPGRTLIIYLVPTSLSGSSSLPITPCTSEPLATEVDVTYLTFQHVRFTMRRLSPNGRWALTSPFHLFLVASGHALSPGPKACLGRTG